MVLSKKIDPVYFFSDPCAPLSLRRAKSITLILLAGHWQLELKHSPILQFLKTSSSAKISTSMASNIIIDLEDLEDSRLFHELLTSVLAWEFTLLD